MKTEESMQYYDSDGALREVENCTLYKDKAERYWLWSVHLNHSLAYKIKGREDCFLAAINSLLFTLQLKDQRIKELQRIADLAEKFANEINILEELC